jgi:DNA-binding transcriptional MerR regulator
VSQTTLGANDQDQPDEPIPDLTIEALATEVDLPYSTIRMYQNRGLLPPPERRGRVGYYGADHVARLHLIAQLKAKGYSLAAIKDLVETWQSGQSLTDALGVERSAAGVLDPLTPIRLRPDELRTRLAGLDLSPETMARAYALGLVSYDDDVIVVHAPVFLEVGADLVAMGVPVDEVLDEYEHLRAVADELAERFAAVFERNLWQPFVDDGLPAARAPDLAASLERLAPLAESIVTATLRQALALVAARFLDRQAKALAEAPTRSPSRSRSRKAVTP